MLTHPPMASLSQLASPQLEALQQHWRGGLERFLEQVHRDLATLKDNLGELADELRRTREDYAARYANKAEGRSLVSSLKDLKYTFVSDRVRLENLLAQQTGHRFRFTENGSVLKREAEHLRSELNSFIQDQPELLTFTLPRLSSVEPVASGFVSRLQSNLLRSAIKFRLLKPDRTVNIPYRSILAWRVLESLPADGRRVSGITLDLEKKVMEQLKSVSDVIRFNLETSGERLGKAISALSVNAEADVSRQLQETAEIALGGLERAEQNLLDIFQIVETTYLKLASDLTGHFQNAHQRVVSDVAHTGSWKQSWSYQEHRAEVRVRDLLRQLDAAISHSKDGLLRRKAQGTDLWEAFLAAAKQWLGLERPQLQQAREVIDEASIRSDILHIAQLPSIYQQLFSFSPVDAEEFLIARETEMQSFEAACGRWRQKKGSSVSITGEKGCGKTSLLNCAVDRFFRNEAIIRHDLTDRLTTEEDLVNFMARLFSLRSVGSLAELIGQLAAGPRRVVILEGGHYLFLRKVGGLQAIQLFLWLVLKTNEHILWCLAFNRPAWDYLERVFRISSYFTFNITASPLNRDMTRQAILHRHRLSGYRLWFELNPVLQKRLKRKLVKLGNDPGAIQGLLDSVYFDDLHQATQGNLFVAIYYWLRSINYAPQESSFRVAPLVALNFGFLDHFTLDHWLSLAALLQHGGLSVEEHRQIFPYTEIESRLILDYFLELNVTSLVPQGGEHPSPRYVINQIMLKPVVEGLYRKHIFY